MGNCNIHKNKMQSIWSIKFLLNIFRRYYIEIRRTNFLKNNFYKKKKGEVLLNRTIFILFVDKYLYKTKLFQYHRKLCDFFLLFNVENFQTIEYRNHSSPDCSK